MSLGQGRASAAFASAGAFPPASLTGCSPEAGFCTGLAPATEPLSRACSRLPSPSACRRRRRRRFLPQFYSYGRNFPILNMDVCTYAIHEWYHQITVSCPRLAAHGGSAWVAAGCQRGDARPVPSPCRCTSVLAAAGRQASGRRAVCPPASRRHRASRLARC